MDDSESSQPPPRRNSMTQDEERERRASIQAIMRDTNLTPQERRKSIQSLMDGRRRSSVVRRDSNRSSHGGSNSMAAAAAAAAQELGSFSDDEDDVIPEDGVVEDAPANRRRSLRSSLRSSFRSGGKRSSLRGSFNAGFSTMGIEDPLGGDNTVDPIAVSRKMEKSRPPCGHYQRNCSIVSPCCGLVFGCRICHDDSPELPPPFLLNNLNHSAVSFDTSDAAMEDVKMPATTNGDVAAAAAATSHRSASLPANFDDEETHHNIDRFAIKEVICRECYTRQSSKTNNCINCGIKFGAYHCNICNLWMSADEDPYHCEKCGFCRVGGRENFTHCNDCGMCIDALLFYDHNCKSGKYMSNCPVCQEDLFSSRMASHEMPCGHAIHWHCFKELTSFDTRCPVCKKTAETHDQMEQTWSAMAMGIALQPVPPDMARVVDITCNDCEKKGTNLRWHFLGVQCQFCTSFNTTVDGTVMTGQEAADFLGPPPVPPSHAQFAAAGVDQNVLAALMENHGDAMDDAEHVEDGMDTEDFSPILAAEVLGYMSGNHFGTSMAEDMDHEGMEEDEAEYEEDDEDQSL